MKNKKTIALAMAAATVAPMAVPAFAAERIAAPAVANRTVDVNKIDGRTTEYVEKVNLSQRLTDLERKELNPTIVGQDKNSKGETLGYVVEFDKAYPIADVATEKSNRDAINKFIKTIKDEKIDGTNKLRYTIKEETTEYTFQGTTSARTIKNPSMTIITVQDQIETNGKYQKYVFTFENVDTKFKVSEDIILEDTKINLASSNKAKEYKELSKYIYALEKAVKKDSLHVATRLEGTNMVVRTYTKDKSTLLKKLTIKGFDGFNSADLTIIPSNNDFTGHWAEEAIVDAMLDNVIKVSATVNPKADMTRAQFAQLVCNTFGFDKTVVPEDFNSPFKDVSKGDWYARYVMQLNKLGLINGFEDGTFRPNDTITRQQAAVVFAAIEKDVKEGGKYKLVDLTTRDSEGKLVHKDIKTKFADDAKIPAWCDEAVAYLATGEEDERTAIISGFTDNTFRPALKIQIAQAIMMSHQARK